MAAPRTVDLLFLALLFLPFRTDGQARKPGVGTATGEGTAEYTLRAQARFPLPDYENTGFRQKVSTRGGAVSIEVGVDLAPRRIRAPFQPKPRALPGHLNKAARDDLSATLKGCQRAGEAAEAILLFCRARMSYRERPASPETPEGVFSTGEASCVGMTRLAAEVLRSQGFICREVLGLKVPPGLGEVTLEGGALHAWLEVDFGSEGRAFYDPWRSLGWVSESYVVLRVGAGLEPGEYAGLLGASLTTVKRSDRIFFEPSAGLVNLLWKRAETAAFTGTLITGKVLGTREEPLSGRAKLSGGGGEVSMDLWEGNFFFRDLEPGYYGLTLTAPGVSAETAPVSLRPMDKRHFLVYSQAGRERVDDGAGRQP